MQFRFNINISNIDIKCLISLNWMDTNGLCVTMKIVRAGYNCSLKICSHNSITFISKLWFIPQTFQENICRWYTSGSKILGTPVQVLHTQVWLHKNSAHFLYCQIMPGDSDVVHVSVFNLHIINLSSYLSNLSKSEEHSVL